MAGMVVGAVLGAIVLIAVVVVVLRRRSKYSTATLGSTTGKHTAQDSILFSNPLFQTAEAVDSRDRAVTLNWMGAGAGAGVGSGNTDGEPAFSRHALGLPLYFHGNIVRGVLENRLALAGRDGVFAVVHDHATDKFGVALIYDTRVRVYPIHLSKAGYLFRGSKNVFPSVHQLVLHYATKTSAALPGRLLYPLENKLDGNAYMEQVCVRVDECLYAPLLCDRVLVPKSVQLYRRVLNGGGVRLWETFPDQPYCKSSEILSLPGHAYASVPAVAASHPYDEASSDTHYGAPVGGNDAEYGAGAGGFYSIPMDTAVNTESPYYAVATDSAGGFYSIHGVEAPYSSTSGFYAVDGGGDPDYQELTENQFYAVPMEGEYQELPSMGGYAMASPYSDASHGYAQASPYAQAGSGYAVPNAWSGHYDQASGYSEIPGGVGYAELPANFLHRSNTGKSSKSTEYALGFQGYDNMDESITDGYFPVASIATVAAVNNPLANTYVSVAPRTADPVYAMGDNNKAAYFTVSSRRNSAAAEPTYALGSDQLNYFTVARDADGNEAHYAIASSTDY